MTHRLIRAFVVAAAAFSCAAAQEDRIRLRSGAEFVGRIVAETELVYRIAFQGGTVDLRKDAVAEVVRAGGDPQGEADRAVLSGLERRADQDLWFFLYRDGVRIGWRHVRSAREIRDGVAGYVRVDRVVFTGRDGGPPDVDLSATEFVDAEDRPRALERRVSAGTSARSVLGKVEDGRITLVERSGGVDSVRRAPFDERVEPLGFLCDRLGVLSNAESASVPRVVFDASTSEFATVGFRRTPRRAVLGGRVLDVVVLRRLRDGAAEEVWYDRGGRIVREELQGGRLIAIATDPEAVSQFAAGAPVAGDELGLELGFAAEGLRLTKPDASWEALPGDAERGLAATLIRAGARASCDVFVLPRDGAPDAAAASLEFLSAVEQGLERPISPGPSRARYGSTEGVRFMIEGSRRGTALKTLCFVTAREGRAYLFLCAAPARSFDDVLPEFERLLKSVVVEERAAERAPRDVEPQDG